METVAPGTLHVPAGHSVHDDDAGVSAYVPAAHVAQGLSPTVAFAEPRLHVAHVDRLPTVTLAPQ